MAAQFIPSGRTSIVKSGETELQMQTEYAARPQPRVTTTIFSKGQVLHKVEKTIGKEIESIEEMHRIEDIIKAQHLEISKIIRAKGLPTVPESRIGLAPDKTRSERLRDLPEIEQVFLVTFDGQITENKSVTGQFKKMFKHVFKELPNMIMVFGELPGPNFRREQGLYEIEEGRILLASTGIDFYLILIKADTPYDAIAPKIKRILDL